LMKIHNCVLIHLSNLIFCSSSKSKLKEMKRE
jgi:hypothetical protein